jgi:hypothetical protein
MRPIFGNIGPVIMRPCPGSGRCRISAWENAGRCRMAVPDVAGCAGWRRFPREHLFPVHVTASDVPIAGAYRIDADPCPPADPLPNRLWHLCHMVNRGLWHPPRSAGEPAVRPPVRLPAPCGATWLTPCFPGHDHSHGIGHVQGNTCRRAWAALWLYYIERRCQWSTLCVCVPCV